MGNSICSEGGEKPSHIHEGCINITATLGNRERQWKHTTKRWTLRKNPRRIFSRVSFSVRWRDEMLRTLLRAGLNTIFAYFAMAMALYSASNIFKIDQIIPLSIIGIIAAGLVLYCMVILQKKALNLPARTLVIQNTITAIIILLFLIELVVPRRSW